MYSSWNEVLVSYRKRLALHAGFFLIILALVVRAVRGMKVDLLTYFRALCSVLLLFYCIENYIENHQNR